MQNLVYDLSYIFLDKWYSCSCDDFFVLSKMNSNMYFRVNVPAFRESTIPGTVIIQGKICFLFLGWFHLHCVIFALMLTILVRLLRRSWPCTQNKNARKPVDVSIIIAQYLLHFMFCRINFYISWQLFYILSMYNDPIVFFLLKNEYII